MKIAMVSPFPVSPGRVSGGVEGVTETLVSKLTEVKSCTVHVIALSVNHKAECTEERGALSIHWLPVLRGPGFLNFWTIDRLRIQKKLIQVDPDVIHLQGVTAYSLGLKKKAVTTLHGIIELDARHDGQRFAVARSELIRQVERLGRTRDDERIVINPYITDYLGSQLAGRHWHIENPVNPAFFKVSRAPESSGFLYVGRISNRKGIHELIRIYARYRELGGTEPLEIAGSAPNLEYQAEVARLAKALVPGGDLVFSGPQDRDVLLRKFAAARALLLFSLQETAPLVIGEAMASGLPVIAYGICGIPYMIKDGLTGHVISPGDHAGAATAMLGLSENEALAEVLSGTARREALARFCPSVVAQKTLEVYRSFLP